VEVMFCEETRDVFCMPVTPACSEGALGTWRSQGGPRTLSRGKAVFEAGTRSWVNQRRRGVCMSVLELRRVLGRPTKESQGQNRNGEIPPSGIVGGLAETSQLLGAGLRPIGKPMELPPDPTVACAPHFYPDLFRGLSTVETSSREPPSTRKEETRWTSLKV
jgi:hypothetical protein